MKYVFTNRLFIISTLITTGISILYIIQKTDSLAFLRMFTHTTPIYILWTLTIPLLLYTSFTLTQNIVLRAHVFVSAFFPSCIAIALTPFFTQTHIHWSITACTGFYFIGYGMIHVHNYDKNHRVPSVSKKTLSQIHIILIILTSILYMYFGITHLGKAFYVDEKLWIYDRIETFWDNIATGDWYNTRPSDKPGVTTALFSGPGLLFFDPSEFDDGYNQKNRLEMMFFSLRLPLFISIFLFLFIAFSYARALTDSVTAIIFFIFLSLSPLLLGISRIINPDALLWIFFLISFLCFMRYLFAQSLSALYCAGIFLGLSLLTKYIANIFIVFYFIVILSDPIIRTDAYVNIVHVLRRRLVQFGIMLFIALSVFYILYPGVWVKHDRMLLATIHSEAFISTWIYFAVFALILIADIFLYRATVTAAIIRILRSYRIWLIRGIFALFAASTILTIYNVYTGMSLFDFMYIIESPKSVYRDVSALALWSASFYPLVFGITPLVFFGVILGVYNTLRTKRWDDAHLLIFYSIAFTLMYYIGSLANHVMPIVRYQIVLYPLIILIASIGWTLAFPQYKKKPTYITIFCITLLVTAFVQLHKIRYFYFSYNSPLLPQKYIINTKDMGEGNYEIAQHLNDLPNAQDLLVWTDKTGICQFFVGTCNNMIQDLSLVDIASEIDYYVVSQNRRNYIERLTRQKCENNPHYPLRLDRLYDARNTKDYEILPGNRTAQFIRILNAKNVNIIDK